MIILPIGTENPFRRRPWVNYALILINVVVFILPWVLPVFGVGRHETLNHLIKDRYNLAPGHPELFGFITYAFLHANLMHILGNMFFLYIFGNSVNEKLGHLGYLVLYLGGGVCAAMGHCLFNAAPIVGASGAVAAVTGAYMVLFPLVHIKVFYWVYFFYDTIEVPAFWFILFKLIVFDNILEPKLAGQMTNVAHGAHLAGYAYGIGVPFLMLAMKLLPHSPYDMWAVIRHWRRRQEFRNMVHEQEYNPFTGENPGRKNVYAKVTDAEEPNPKADRINSLRATISQNFAQSDLKQAAENYLTLIGLDSGQVLPQQQQLDVANKLMHSQQYESAAWAYENFLTNYPRYPFLEQVQLMTGLLYSRYLNRPAEAKKHLAASLEKLTDAGQRQMCQAELDNL